MREETILPARGFGGIRQVVRRLRSTPVAAHAFAHSAAAPIRSHYSHCGHLSISSLCPVSRRLFRRVRDEARPLDARRAERRGRLVLRPELRRPRRRGRARASGAVRRLARLEPASARGRAPYEPLVVLLVSWLVTLVRVI